MDGGREGKKKRIEGREREGEGEKGDTINYIIEFLHLKV